MAELNCTCQFVMSLQTAGTVAVSVAAAAGFSGRVVGIDISEAMLQQLNGQHTAFYRQDAMTQASLRFCLRSVMSCA